MKLSEHEFRTKIKSMGVECLDKHYINRIYSHKFRCLIHQDYTWAAKWRDMYASKSKSYCKLCTGKIRFTVKDVRKILNEYCFTLESTYKDLGHQITIKCKRCLLQKTIKHAKTVLYNRPFCKNCDPLHNINKGIGRSGTFMERLKTIKRYCAKHGVEFLSKEYKLVTDRYQYQCNNKHQWETTFSDLKKSFQKNRNGCFQCAVDNSRFNLDQLKQEYFNRGFILHTDVYHNSKSKYDTECMECGLVWETSKACIFNHESRCPNCALLRNERYTGDCLRELFPNVKIKLQKKINIKITKNNKIIKNYLVVDYYFKLNNNHYVVEYNGAQHYNITRFTKLIYKDQAEQALRDQQLRDQQLREYCIKNNISLIEIDGRITKGRRIKKLLNEYFIKEMI